MGTGKGRGGVPGRLVLSLVGTVAVLVFLLAACGEKEAHREPARIVVALVNNQPLGLPEFKEKLAEQMRLIQGGTFLKPEDLERLKEAALNRLIEETLMLQRAAELSLAVGDGELAARIEALKGAYDDEEFDALFQEGPIGLSHWKEALRRRLLIEKVIEQDVNARIVVSQDEARRHYEARRKAYQTPRRVRAAQIVVRDRDRAEEILKRLMAGEDFGKVAREASIGPEAAQGGDLGFFERGRMPEAIDRVVFSLPAGRFSGVVQSPYGYHIFKLLAREDAGGKTFAEVSERVVADLRRLKEVEAYEHWVDGLKSRAIIEVARPLPDVQLEVPPRH
jgi:parvulin-like peptidyl-prolyl isomerase